MDKGKELTSLTNLIYRHLARYKNSQISLSASGARFEIAASLAAHLAECGCGIPLKDDRQLSDEELDKLNKKWELAGL